MGSAGLTPGWTQGLEVLRERQRGLASAVAAALDATSPLPRLEGPVVVTGVGSSLAHARCLAWLLRTRCGIPAWDAPSGAWLEAPDPSVGARTLVVFSQGLSPNARFPLAHAGRYRHTLLVTAAETDSPERAAALRSAVEAGVQLVPLGCPPEYEVLLRIVGPAVGYAVAMRLANASGAGLALDGRRVAEAMDEAVTRTQAQLAAADPALLADPIVLVTSAGHGVLAHNLAAKVQEGMYLPFPPTVDALELAHGTVQESAGKRRTFLALATGATHEDRLFARARATLEPQHRWLRLDARLGAPLSLFEHEAMLNTLVLAAIAARRLDQRDWPGKGRDGPLYTLASTPELAEPVTAPPPPKVTTTRRLAELTWPEVERRIRDGMRTAIVPLGALEQHGPHLPLEVDTSLAEALADRFCAQVPEALQAPVLPFGCSEEHLSFPGTLSLFPDTFARVVGDLLASLAAQGFEHLVVFSAHGGNDGPLTAAEEQLRERAGSARVTVVHGIDRISRLWHAASAREGVPANASGHHAGEYETSIVAMLKPEAVRWAAVRPGMDGEVPEPQRLFYPRLRDHAPDGVVGDPTHASGERGERYLAAWAELLVAEYRRGRE